MTFPSIRTDLSAFGETAANLLGAPNGGRCRERIRQEPLHLAAIRKRVGSSQLRPSGLPASDRKGEN